MISVERCREIIDEDMSDSEVLRLREALYAMVESILDNYFEEFNGKIDVCRKQSYIAEYPLQNRALMDTG